MLWLALQSAQHLRHAGSRISERKRCLAYRHTKWSTCAISGQPLAGPIAADWLGRLYNAEVRHLSPASINTLIAVATFQA
jgi:Rtf2 RING-finger